MGMLVSLSTNALRVIIGNVVVGEKSISGIQWFCIVYFKYCNPHIENTIRLVGNGGYIYVLYLLVLACHTTNNWDGQKDWKESNQFPYAICIFLLFVFGGRYTRSESPIFNGRPSSTIGYGWELGLITTLDISWFAKSPH